MNMKNNFLHFLLVKLLHRLQEGEIEPSLYRLNWNLVALGALLELMKGIHGSALSLLHLVII